MYFKTGIKLVFLIYKNFCQNEILKTKKESNYKFIKLKL